jgi:hypothetical protein
MFGISKEGVPLWKDQTLHCSPSLERPNITLYSLSGETKHYIMLV